MIRNKKQKGSEDEFDMKQIIGNLLDHWKLFVISVIVFLLLTFLFIKLSTPRYTVHAQVLIQDQQSGNSSLFGSSSPLSDLSDLFNVPSNVNNELAILQTRDLMDKVVKEMKLYVKYYEHGAVTSVELWKKLPFTVNFLQLSDSILNPVEFDIKKTNGHGLFIKTSDLDTSFNVNYNTPVKTSIGTFTVEPGNINMDTTTEYSFVVSSVDATIEDVQEDLTIQIPDKTTTVIDIQLNVNLPEKGQEILAQLINDYIKGNLETKNTMSDSTIAFINSRIGLVSSDLEGIEKNVASFKEQNNIANLSAQSKEMIDNATTYYDKQNQIDVQLNVVDMMLKYLQDATTNTRPVPALLTTDPTFSSLLEKYNEALIQRDRLSLSSTADNPIAQNLDTQIANMRSDLIKSLTNQQKALTVARDNLAAQNGTIRSLMSKVPEQERQFLDLSRQQDIKQQLYIFLLQKKEETAITKASNIPSASVIQTPKSDFKPYFPKKILLFPLGFLLGLIIPGIYIIAKFFLNTKVLSRSDIEQVTDVPTIAEISHSNKPDSMMLVNNDSRSVVAEQFRAFRTNLQFLSIQRKCPIYLVTSSMSGEGKSFIATNLAQVSALSGKRVLLMEMDLRKPKISTALGMENKVGFTNYIISDLRLRDIIRPVETAENVYLLSSGLIPPNPAELLLNPKMKDMFEELRDNYDLIIIDSPPVGLVTDTQILAEYSDVNLYVVRLGYTFKNQLELLNDMMNETNSNFKNLYLIANDIKAGASYKYGYGYSYGYGYGYGYGNGSENGTAKKRRRLAKASRKN
jgi:capsular exopolysaccharide synthesis family protein